jgi:hypothetical protein
MIIDYDSIPITIQPSEGYKYITNGEIWTDFLYLGKNDKVENWHDTNEEPPEEPEEPEEPATEQDYINALDELGVNTND